MTGGYIGPVDALDEYLAESLRIMMKHGWLVQGVIGSPIDSGAVCWYYTVGLTGRDHPELMLSGLPSEVATPVINDMARRVFHDGTVYRDGNVVDDIVTGFNVAMRSVTRFDTFPPSMVRQFFPTQKIRALQVVLPDAEGRFPWDEDYAIGDLQDLMYAA